MAKFKGYQKSLNLTHLRNLESRVDRFLKDLTKKPGYSNLPRSFLQDLKLAMAEGITNAFQHGGCSKSKPARVLLQATPKQIEVQISDAGKGFQWPRSSRRLPDDFSVDGRGLWIMKNLVDRVSYQRGRPNRLRLIKKLTRPKSIDAAMELIRILQDSLQSLRPVDFLYDQFVDFIMGLFNVERASFLVYDQASKSLKVATSRGISAKVAKTIRVQPGEGVAGYVFQTSRPMLVNKLSGMKKSGPRPRKKGYASQSFVSVPVIASPLHIGEETLGVLNLTDRRDGSRFSQRDLKLLNLMAAQAASIFRIRNLIDTVKHHEGLNRELEIVSEIQDRLIPDKFPHVDSLQVGGACQLSPRGGGDYYDVLKVGNKLRGVVADVSGHNVGSAITMASFRSIVRSSCFDPTPPGQMLQALRWAMHEELIRLHQFISCWVFEFGPAGQLKVSGAGHPPLLIYRDKQKNWEEVYSHHLPLGLADESRIQNHAVKLKKGDWVFFYTDGLFDPRMRETGFDRQIVLDLIEKNLRLTPQTLVEKIFAELAPHHRLLRSPDDVAILALKQK